MFDQVIGNEVASFEVFEPWCSEGASVRTGEPAFGGLALNFTSGHTVLINSNTRYGHLGASTSKLRTSVFDEVTWGLRRAQLSDRIRLLGRKGCTSYRQSRLGSSGCDCVPFLPIPLGVPLNFMQADSSVCGGDERVGLQFSGHQATVDFVSAPVFDSGIMWKRAFAPNAVSIDLHPGGEFAWMHPSARLPVRYGDYLLNSGDYQDWPLGLRRTVFSSCWKEALAQMRQTYELAVVPELWALYEKTTAEILVQRWRQCPFLHQRLSHVQIESIAPTPVGKIVIQAIQQYRNQKV